MQLKSHKILVIAGTDPTSGAGLLSDIKTATFNDVYAFGVVTAVTAQNENEFYKLNWVKSDLILKQIISVLQLHNIEAVKIGIFENLNVLIDIIETIDKFCEKVPVVWDPVLKSSSGFTFHKSLNRQRLLRVLEKIELSTPNYNEFKGIAEIMGYDTSEFIEKFLKSGRFNMLIKGGHRLYDKGEDILFWEGKEYFIDEESGDLPGKHGSGCVLSTAIASGLAKSYDLKDAAEKAKKYTEAFLLSNNSLLGIHKCI